MGIFRGLTFSLLNSYEQTVCCMTLASFFALRALQPLQNCHFFSHTSRERERERVGAKLSREVATNVPLSHYTHTVKPSYSYFNLPPQFKKRDRERERELKICYFGDLGVFIVSNPAQNSQPRDPFSVFFAKYYFFSHRGQTSNT